MNIPTGAMDQIIPLLINSLPYHDPIEATTPEGQLLIDIKESIKTVIPGLDKIDGFFWFNVSILEKSKDHQRMVGAVVNIIDDCIFRYKSLIEDRNNEIK